MGSLIERKRKDGSISLTAVYRIEGKQKWRVVPPEYVGKAGAKRFLLECEAGDHDKTLSITLFKVVADRWLAVQHARQTTVNNYIKILKSRVLPQFGDRDIAAIKPSDIRLWVSGMIEEGLSPGYIQATPISVVRRIFKFAIEDELISRSPADIKLTYPASEKKVGAMTAEQVRQMLHHAPPEWLHVFQTAVLTGMRIGEILAMKWANLDLDTRRYHINETLAGYGVFNEPKTAASKASVALSNRMMAVLDDQKQLNAKARLRAAKWTDMDLIFPNGEGMARCHSAVRKALARTLRLADIDHFRVHDLRHTAASLLIAEGVDIKSVSGLLRHASVKITYDKYGHLYPEQEDQAVEALERAIAI